MAGQKKAVAKVTVAIRMNPELKAALEREADADDRTLSAHIERILAARASALKPKPPRK